MNALQAVLGLLATVNSFVLKVGRWFGFGALLLMVVAKLFLVDMAGLEGLWRVASFMGLGLSLLALAYLYQLQLRKHEELQGKPGSG